MTPLSLLAAAARSAVILGLALAAMPLLRRAPASTRRLVLAFALAAAALVPFAARAVPSWRVLPAAELHAVDNPFAEPAGEAVAAPAIELAGAPVAPVFASRPTPAERSFPWGSALIVVWALGALAVLARLAFGLVQARAIARRGVSLSLRAIEAPMREAGAEARVVASAEVDAPAVTGVFSPVVLVPLAALEWSDARWRAVLLHELAHVRQRDCLAQIVGQIACALSWFDPLAWLAARRLRTERELAADERVLSAGTRPSDYAEHLLAIAIHAVRSRAVPCGALGMAERSELLARVEAILRPGAGTSRPSMARAVTIAALAAALLGVVACVNPGESPSATPEASSPAVPLPSSVAPDAAGPLAAEVAAVMGAPADRVELTIRPEIQAIAEEEMKRLDAEWHPLASTAIVLDPSNGEVLALVSPAVATRVRVSGSTMKSLMIAAALEDGAVTPQDKFFCDNGGRTYGKLTLRDAAANGELDVAQILTVSSNIGASRIFDKLGGAPLGKWLRRFHLGGPSGVQLREEPIGEIPPIEDGSFAGATVAGGMFGLVGTPMHMAAAYAAIANHGVYNPPAIARRVLGADGKPTFEHKPANERVLRPETAAAVMAMLERVVTDEKGTGKAARVAGARVAGKTGTSDEKSSAGESQLYASFIGVAPADAPRFVILVGALVPGEEGTGGKVAAPVFARITARLLSR